MFPPLPAAALDPDIVNVFPAPDVEFVSFIKPSAGVEFMVISPLPVKGSVEAIVNLL